MNSIGQNIRALRQQNGWSQHEIAKRLNISIPAVSKIETGRTDVNMSRVVQIAAVFDITVLHLIGNANEAYQSENTLVLADLREKIQTREAEITQLQAKLINLYEQAR